MPGISMSSSATSGLAGQRGRASPRRRGPPGRRPRCRPRTTAAPPGPRGSSPGPRRAAPGWESRGYGNARGGGNHGSHRHRRDEAEALRARAQLQAAADRAQPLGHARAGRCRHRLDPGLRRRRRPRPPRPGILGRRRGPGAQSVCVSSRRLRLMKQFFAPEWRITLVTASRRHQASAASASGSNVPDSSVSSASSCGAIPALSRAVRAVMISTASVGRRYPLIASRMSCRVCRLTAATCSDLVGDPVPVGAFRQPPQQPGRELGLERDHRQRLAGQVVHVPGEPQPLLARRELRHLFARLAQLGHQLQLHPEARSCAMPTNTTGSR